MANIPCADLLSIVKGEREKKFILDGKIHSRELLRIIKDKREEISGQSPIKSSILPDSILGHLV